MTVAPPDSRIVSVSRPAGLLDELLAVSPAALFAVDDQARLQFLNPAWSAITGFDPADCIGRQCADFVHPDDYACLVRKLTGLFSGQITSSRSEYRVARQGGGYCWVEVQAQASLLPEGHVAYLFGTISDISDRKRREALTQGEQAVLEAIAGEASQRSLLNQICRLYESLIPESLCSILLLDEAGRHLRFEAGPSLPDAYNAAIDGVAIGPAVGSCGTAAYTKQPVIVPDVCTDERWCDYRELALSHGLRACWSFPVAVDSGTVHGTFAVYRTRPHKPDEWESELAQRLARLTAIVTKKKRAEAALEASEQRHTLVMQGANVGLWEMNFGRSTLFLSEAYRAMIGLAPDEPVHWPYPDSGIPPYLRDRLHPDDVERTVATLRHHLEGCGAYDTVHRIRQPDGQYRWFQAKGQANWDEDGKPVLMAGSIYDITDQVIATAQLRDSEQRFRDFAETASDWYWETDVKHRISAVSDWILDSAGLEPSAVVGRPLVEIVAEDTHTQKWLEHFGRLRARQGFRNFEYAYRHPSGDILYYRINGKPVFSADGAFTGYRGTGTDVTRERRMLVAYADRQRQLSEAQRIAALGDWRLEVSSGMTEWSDEVYRIFGEERGSFVPTLQNILDRMVAEDAARIAQSFARSIAERIPFEAEHRIRRADGEERILWVEARCELSEAGEATHIYGICQDVTERVRQQKALEQREQELLDAQRTARMGHWRLAMDTGVLSLSQGSHDLLGTTGEGQAPTWDEYQQLIHPDDQANVIETLTACVVTGQPGFWEYRIRTLHGEERIAAVQGQCELDNAGRVVAVFGIVQDVTDQRRMEAKLRAAKEAAEAASRAKSTFLATMSHELRTPLNAVIGFSEILNSETFGPLGHPSYREYADYINLSGRHLLDLINDVLNVAQIEAGKVELFEEALALDDLVGEAVGILRQTGQNAGVTIEMQLPTPAPRISGDRRRLSQVLLNLIGNAVKFTPAGGQVCVTVSICSPGITISVSDTGIGILPERIAELCQPFTQVNENVMTRRHQGIGMGLYISRNLVERHGGQLEIESEPGGGTSVHVILPPERLLPLSEREC